MFELCADTRQGKKSQRETQFENIDWTEVTRLRKQADERARAGQGQEENRDEADRQREAEAREREGVVRGPQLKIVNGQMVIDTDSLVIARAPAGPGAEGTDVIEESDLTHNINSQTWLYDNRRDPDERFKWAAKSDPWTDEQTEQFYDALRMFGTDFFIISKMFPGKSRRMIKMKFVREERSSAERIRAALLGEQVPMSLAAYCAATGNTEDDFKDPEVLERELREQDENQKAELEKQQVEKAEKAKEKQEAAKARAEGKQKGPGRPRKVYPGDAEEVGREITAEA